MSYLTNFLLVLWDLGLKAVSIKDRTLWSNIETNTAQNETKNEHTNSNLKIF